MQVLSHRGYWREPAERNTSVAFRRSFALGFGTETDVRDHDGRLVVSHDPPTGQPMALSDFLRILAASSTRPLPLAVNIKADGLAVAVAEAMADCGHDWFVFDMSTPDLIQQLKAGNPVFLRASEYETPADDLLARADGVWLDAFTATWYSRQDVERFLDRGLRVCVVSPELHGRTPDPLWTMLKPLAQHPRLSLCTDEPERAQDWLEVSTTGLCGDPNA